MSASNSTISPASRERKSPPMVMPSMPALADRLAPTESIAAENSAASRSPAPFSINDAYRLARPPLPLGSAAAPPRKIACTPIMGTSCFSIMMSTAPFGNSTRVASGRLTSCAKSSDENTRPSSVSRLECIYLIVLLPAHRQPAVPVSQQSHLRA